MLQGHTGCIIDAYIILYFRENEKGLSLICRFLLRRIKFLPHLKQKMFFHLESVVNIGYNRNVYGHRRSAPILPIPEVI